MIACIAVFTKMSFSEQTTFLTSAASLAKINSKIKTER
jgi:hypothetical protein